MLHFMKLHNQPYELIKKGAKVIELRLYDEKRQKIKPGDVIEFTNIKSNEKMGCVVKNLYIYKNFKELYEKFNKTELGYLDDEEASYKDMEKYYSIDDIEKHGVVGILIKKLTHMEYLEYMYNLDSKQRIENTYKLMIDIANENMQGEEKENFLNDLKK